MWKKGMCAAMLVTLPISAVMVGNFAWVVSRMFSPCVGWGGKPPTANGSCKQYSTTSQTRARSLLAAVPLHDAIIRAAFLGAWGTSRLRQLPVVGAGLLMLLEAIPLMWSAGPLAVLAGVGLLVLAYRMEHQPGFSSRVP